ncbi:MAG: ribosome maturation factor RimM [Alphaproteobacteria bacterium]|nr:ribosome maturation factor RimM [Alphaproteobacteria bacterium]
MAAPPRKPGWQQPGRIAKKPGHVCIGVITGVRGLKGDLRVKSFTSNPKDVGAYGPVTDATGDREFALSVIGMAKEQVMCRIAGIADRTAAEALKGTQLFVPRDALPAPDEDEYYHADLIGLAAVEVGEDGKSEPFGRILGVYDFGAGDVLEVERPSGETVMLPFTRQVVPEVNLSEGRLVVNPPDGLFETPDTGQDETEGNGNEG